MSEQEIVVEDDYQLNMTEIFNDLQLIAMEDIPTDSHLYQIIDFIRIIFRSGIC